MSIQVRSEDFAALLDGAPDAMVVVDEDATIRLAESSHDRVVRLAPGELVGRPIEVLVPDRFTPDRDAYRTRDDSRSPTVRTPWTRDAGCSPGAATAPSSRWRSA